MIYSLAVGILKELWVAVQLHARDIVDALLVLTAWAAARPYWRHYIVKHELRGMMRERYGRQAELLAYYKVKCHALKEENDRLNTENIHLRAGWVRMQANYARGLDMAVEMGRLGVPASQAKSRRAAG